MITRGNDEEIVGRCCTELKKTAVGESGVCLILYIGWYEMKCL